MNPPPPPNEFVVRMDDLTQTKAYGLLVAQDISSISNSILIQKKKNYEQVNEARTRIF